MTNSDQYIQYQKKKLQGNQYEGLSSEGKPQAKARRVDFHILCRPYAK